MDIYKKIAEKVRFEIFSLTICPYVGLAFDDPDDHTQLCPVCYANVPQDSSWGKCDKNYCPYYGVEMTMSNIVAYNKNGEKMFTADSGNGKGVER